MVGADKILRGVLSGTADAAILKAKLGDRE